MVQRTVLKVQLSCKKCKKKMLKSISGLEGVDKIEIDAVKDTLTITGNANPYEIIVKARKAVKLCVEVITIGPPPPPPKKKDSPIKGVCIAPYGVACQPVAVVHTTHDPCTTCSIM